MPTIAELNQSHPCRNMERDKDLRALYQGDEALTERLHKFLPQREREEPVRYALRKGESHYRNYLGAIIDYFAAMLFTSKPTTVAKNRSSKEAGATPSDYYAAFREDCDRLGGDVDAFFKERITDAMVYQRAWFSIEQPSNGGVAATDQAEFDRRKLGDCWLKGWGNESIVDWEVDDAGALEMVLTHKVSQKRAGLGSRNQITEIWEHYQVNQIDVYSITYEADKKPEPATQVPLVSTRRHNFGRVPMLCIELPFGLWAANRLKTPQLAHFRAINAQSWSLTCTCYAMPVAKVGDPEAFVKARQGAGYGIVIGVSESWEWEAPPTEHFGALDTEIKAHKDEIFRIAHQMALGVENNAAAVGRTAESKIADAQSTRVILTAYGRVIKEVIELAYDLISAARGDNLVWSVGGLDEFAGIGTSGLIAILAELADAGGIPSQAFNSDIKSKVASAVMADAPEERKRLYQEQIEANTPDPADDPTDIEKLHAAALGLTNNANGGGARGGGGKKPPAAPPGGSGGSGATSKPS